jgi:hypothetical protein
VINFSEQQSAHNSHISINAATTATSGALCAEPGIQSLKIKPERETSTPDESFVIVRPVTDAVLRFGFLLGHA